MSLFTQYLENLETIKNLDFDNFFNYYVVEAYNLYKFPNAIQDTFKENLKKHLDENVMTPKHLMDWLNKRMKNKRNLIVTNLNQDNNLKWSFDITWDKK